MKKLLDTLSNISLVISASCLTVMTAIISYQVVARYFFNSSPAWSERLSLVLLAYLVFFGAAVGVHERFHIRIDALRNAVPDGVGRAFDIVANLAVAIAGVVMVIAGMQLTTTLWAFDIPSLGLPRGLALLPLPIAGGLIALFSTAQLFESFSDRSEETR
ncbi:MAG: TRAP transporter small permease [Hyphomonadaceae bacterium]|nr:TRAP transporter small permease [Hyphomonadaceae bacterium]